MNVALDTLRMPYWDAAAIPPLGTSSLPNIVQSKTVDVDVPNGASTTKITIPNPLYAYTFHPLPVADFETPGSKAWTLWGSTKRYPTTRDNSAESRNTEIGQSLDANRQNLMQATYQILGMQKRYVDISNNLAGSADKSAIPNNLESVHDTLHNTVGHGGHMYDTAFSAFDPIFWLLHT
jgi:tyrosinase